MWLTVAPPAWLLPTEPVIPAPDATVRNLAVDLLGQAEDVVALYLNRGVLPATLAELEPMAKDIRYRTTGPASFELRTRIGDTVLTLPVSIQENAEPNLEVATEIGTGP